MTDKTEAQPEALRLAQFFESLTKSSHRWWDGVPVHEKAATVLRAQSAEIEQLKAQLSARQAVPDERLRTALERIIEWNRTHALDLCGDAERAEGWACVREARAALSATPPQPEREPQCWCETCDTAANGGLRTRMSLCPTCGNKRCPRSSHHDNACTNSNAPGQEGSNWEHVKPHGATNAR